jgi:vanillate O-demethylase ferredoxin subunit
VIEGIPDHRDSFLSDEEKADNSKIMVCCSRSKSAVLTLDL